MTRPVSFHDSVSEEDLKKTSLVKDAVARAKARGGSRPGPLSGTPRFDELPTEPEDKPPAGVEPRETLSPKTVDGLNALAEAAELENAARPQEAPMEEAPPEPELSQEEQLKNAIEARCSPIDIGQYLNSGELTQAVPIIPEKLVVVFRTVQDLEEVWVDARLSNESEMSRREFYRRTNEWSLASHIHVVNGTKWPSYIDGDGTINDESMEMRLKMVRKFPSPIFNMLLQNLGWFLDRVNDSLTLAAMGNG